MFPASAVSSKFSSEKINITLKLENYWGDNTLDDLTKLVGLFGITGEQLHLAKVGHGSIIVLWLCSATKADALKRVIVKAADELQSMGVLQVFIGEEIFLDFDQSKNNNLTCLFIKDDTTNLLWLDIKLHTVSGRQYTCMPPYVGMAKTRLRLHM